jgi:Enoyl-(Acyl carrier protein) reductase
MLTRGMYADWASFGLQVNAIAPGYFDTELTAALVNDDEFTDWLVQRTPAGRWGRAEDLVGALLFFASAGIRLRQRPDRVRRRRSHRRRIAPPGCERHGRRHAEDNLTPNPPRPCPRPVLDQRNPTRRRNPRKTSPTPNRCRTGVRFGPCPTPSSHRMSPTRSQG